MLEKLMICNWYSCSVLKQFQHRQSLRLMRKLRPTLRLNNKKMTIYVFESKYVQEWSPLPV